MHLGMERIRGPSGEEKARLDLILYNVKFMVENPVFAQCKEQRVVIKLVYV